MDPTHFIAQVVFATVTLVFVVALGVRLVRFAKRGSPGAQLLGAGFLLVTPGNVTDPENQLLQRAQQIKQREDDDSGDPPDPDERGGDR